MNLIIPFLNKKIIIKINLEICHDETLIAIMKNRFHNSLSGKWRLDRTKAINFYHNQTGLDLIASKKYIDKLVEKNHLELEIEHYVRERYAFTE